MRQVRLLFPALALTVVVAGSAPAQARVPVITLDRGAKEFAESFSAITQVLELRSGSLLVLDDGEKELRLVDLARGTMRPVGRQGGGPLEYKVPGLLLPGAADTASYYDAMQQRLLLVSPQGTVLRTAPLGVTGDVASMISRMQPAGTDAAGHIYGQTTGMKMPTPQSGTQGPMPTFADTIQIQSLDLRSGKTTRLATIRSPVAKLAPKMEMAGRNVKLIVTAPDFSPQDVWTALPDGRVAMMRDGLYQVRFVAAGRAETKGPLIPSVAIPVTAREKKALVDSVRKVMDSIMAQATKQSAAAGGQGAAPSFTADVLEPPRWPAYKPPYMSLQSSPDGRLWVSLSQPTGNQATKFDVLNSAGALIAQVVLAPGERFVGLGRGTVYTVRKDEDDLQYVRKYVLPKLP